ncbi:MAG: NADH-quinone oxidoreductase subunit N [Elusimicrobia bacterium]|nr:NADH-quinone oxidoreductase subunit N [Elusimicrobiota bacterium]
MIASLSLIRAELLLTAAAVFLLLLDNGRQERKGLSVWIAGLALGIGAWLVLDSSDGTAFNVETLDAGGRFLKVLILGAVLLVLALCHGFSGFEGTEDHPFHWCTFAGLLLLSSVGLLLMVSANDFLMILISVELVSVTSFILTGFRKDDRRGSEAAIKYFLVGAFSSGLMVYGMSLLYGVTGGTSVSSLFGPGVASLPALPLTGALFFLLAGFGFKLALVPFHMWAPDVYEGAPTPITAFLSVAPKAAAFGLMIRVFQNHGALHVSTLLAVLAALTMTVGNLAALRQTNVKRLLAYSSIAQMGYVMMGIVAAGPAGLRSVLVYLTAYVFTNLGAFASVIAVTEDAKTESIEGFAGLAFRSFPLALLTTFFLLSLTGIPPLVGFIGKFSLFSAVLQTPGLVWLAVVGAVNSVISLAYYFSIVRVMFFVPASRMERVSLSLPVRGCLGVTSLATVGVGVFPNLLLVLVKAVWP